MPPQIELAGVSVVGAGAFNPAIFHPLWFAEKQLIPRNAIDEALGKDFVAVRELSAFTADWLSVQVTTDQAALSTVEEGRELDLRDLAKSVFDLLPETPVTAIGINADAHFRVGSEEQWHAIGDRFLPKDFWQPMFEGDQWKRRSDGQTVGMRAMVVEAWRDDVAAFVRAEVAPSIRLSPQPGTGRQQAGNPALLDSLVVRPQAGPTTMAQVKPRVPPRPRRRRRCSPSARRGFAAAEPSGRRQPRSRACEADRWRSGRTPFVKRCAVL
jgi:hypothetical protein